MKKLDYLLIIIYISLSLGFGFYFSKRNIPGDFEIKTVEIFSENNLYATYDLPVKEPVKLRIDSEYGYNIIIIEEDKVSILESDCRDQICVKEGSIDKNGEMLVCLPNKLLVQIVGNKEDSVDGVSY